MRSTVVCPAGCGITAPCSTSSAGALVRCIFYWGCSSGLDFRVSPTSVLLFLLKEA